MPAAILMPNSGFSQNPIKNASTCYLFSPPCPVKKFYYKCDRKFHLYDLLKLYETHDNYAIVLVSGKRCEFYTHNQNETVCLKQISEDLPNQHKTGGSSAARFGRIRDQKIDWYAKKIVELMVRFYIKENIFQCKGLIIAGPAQMKDLIQSVDLFEQHFQKHLLKSVAVPEITDQSIHQIIRLSSDIFTSETCETELIDQFESKLSDTSQIELLVFGAKMVLMALESGQLKEIYVSDKSAHKKNIIKTNTKTRITIIKSDGFSSKYGELVGIKYYANQYDPEMEN